MRKIIIRAALLASVAAAPAYAQTGSTASTSAPDRQGEAATADDGTIVVSGYAASIADALQTKRLEVGISDGISLEGIGRYPDLNLGEALQRVPGVQLNREVDNRDAQINLRGLPGQFARTTLNGQSFADPVLNGSTPLGAFESDIFSAIQIIKSPSAADQPGGLSGNIDLRIQSALDRKDGALTARAGVNYEELGENTNPFFGASYTHHNSEGTFGIYLSGAYSKQNFRRDSLTVQTYNNLNTTTTPGYAGLVDSARPTVPVQFPSSVRQFSRISKGDRYSIAGGVEFRPDDNLSVGLNGFYTKRNYDKGFTYFQILDFRSANTIITPTGSAFNVDDGRRFISDYTATNARIETSTRHERLATRSWALTGDIEWKNDDWRASAVATYSKGANAVFDQDQIDYIEQAGTLAAPNGIAATVRTGRGNLNDLLFNITSPNPVVTFAAGPFVPNPGNAGQVINGTPANGDVLQILGTSSFARNNVKAAQFDVERYLDTGFLSAIQIGARYEGTEYKSNNFRTSAIGVRTGGITSAFITDNPVVKDFFGGQAPGYNRNWQATNFDLAKAALQPVTVPPGAILTPTGFVNNNTDGQFREQNFLTKSDIMSAYAMAKIDADLGGMRLRGSLGLRYETTDTDTRAQIVNRTGQLATNVVKDSYDYWLPSALLALDITDNLILRGAYYKTFVRPLPRQIRTGTTVNPAGNGRDFTVNVGGTVNPYTADSFDVSLEWYTSPGNVIAVSLFEKRVRGLTIGRSGELCPADATNLGLGQLTRNGTDCVSNLTNNAGENFRVVFNTLENSPDKLKLRGIEANVQQTFTFLPKPFDGLGVSANYSYVDRPTRTQTSFTGISTHNFNVIGFYETELFGVRAAYTYRTKYDLAGINTFTGGARSVKVRGQLDASASVNITENFALTADVFNITEAKRVEFENYAILPRRFDFDGRTWQFGVRATF